jgi:hypothetical protein
VTIFPLPLILLIVSFRHEDRKKAKRNKIEIDDFGALIFAGFYKTLFNIRASLKNPITLLFWRMEGG